MKRPNTFKRYLKMIRPFDWIIVGGLFIAASFRILFSAFMRISSKQPPRNRY